MAFNGSRRDGRYFDVAVPVDRFRPPAPWVGRDLSTVMHMRATIDPSQERIGITDDRGDAIYQNGEGKRISEEKARAVAREAFLAHRRDLIVACVLARQAKPEANAT